MLRLTLSAALALALLLATGGAKLLTDVPNYWRALTTALACARR